MKVIIGSDKSGFTLKESIKGYLTEKNIEFIEIGTKDFEKGVPFFQVAPEAAKYLQKNPEDKGILICGTGMGMSQVANKYQGVRAACVESVYASHMCRAINNSNVLCMGGWVIAPEMGLKMVEEFLETAHLQGLEEWRQKFLQNAAVEFQKLEEDIYSSEC